jgi:GNAT superfamily N-acetyltransferase
MAKARSKPLASSALELLAPEGLAALAGRIERAQAAQNAAVAGRKALPLAGGIVVFDGPGSPLTQAVAFGLGTVVTTEQLDQAEQHMGQAPGLMQVETTVFTDPGLFALLAERQYRVAEFQQVLVRPLPGPGWKTPPAVEVRPIGQDEGERFVRVVAAAFGGGEPTAEQLGWMLPTTRARGSTCFLAFVDGEAVGGATVSTWQGVATLAGAGVLPGFRRRGVHAALIAARMDAGFGAGCDVAASSSWPGTSSQRNLERLGFRVAYPKVVLVREAGTKASGAG